MTSSSPPETRHAAPLRTDGHDGQLHRWTYLKLDPGITVQATRPMPALPEALEQRVAEIWDEACRERPKLFNGRIFCADRITPERIEGHWSEYRRALARIREPVLAETLNLHQLAVCGAVRCPQGMVIGRRNPEQLYLGGFWQTPPAGTVESREAADGDAVDLAAQILTEAEEELGLDASSLRVSGPFFAATHPESGIVDLGMTLDTDQDFSTIEASWRACGNTEYDQLELMQRGDQSRLNTLLPTSRWLVEL